MSNTEHSSDLIFGYGGLILPASRSATLGAEVKAIPATLAGFERFWGFRAPAFRLTSLSLRPNARATCVGVLFPITPAQLEQLDLRESGYARVALSPTQLRVDQPQTSWADKAIYTYISQQADSPNADNPIVQSEVDVILVGCLKEYGEAFTREVIRTTSGWENPWLDERKSPRYPWALRENPFAPFIDQLLQEMIPVAYQQRKKIH